MENMVQTITTIKLNLNKKFMKHFKLKQFNNNFLDFRIVYEMDN